MTWTHFWDMHSGGGLKEPWHHIYIEAPKEEAKLIFYNHFGHNPERVTCTCCGEDYAINSHESLQQLTGYHRGCWYLETPRGEDGRYLNDDPVIREHLYLEEGEEPPEGYRVAARQYRRGPHVPFEEWLGRDGETGDGSASDSSFKLLRASEIRPEERRGELPEQGYVWAD